mmetsp:Transcript_26005/g.56996  ORF Transcript_26005/g.56996 Transcript_26005/m.56996 type:complete len:503 (-) Transcript_26005:1084-2592(-)
MKYNHMRIFLSCLIVCLGVGFTRTFVKMQLEVVDDENIGLYGRKGPVKIAHDTSKKKIHHSENGTNSSNVDILLLPQSNSREHGLSSFSSSSLSPVVKQQQSLSTSKSNETSSRSEQTVEMAAPYKTLIQQQQQHRKHEYPSFAESRVQFQDRDFQNGTKHDAEAPEILEFTRQEGVAIVVKVHGPHQLPLLKQSMCLLHYAYNRKVNYDIVVFTTVPITESSNPLLEEIRTIISPAKITVVSDNDGIVDEIGKLSPLRRRNFLDRCNATSPEQITWDSECYEEGMGMGRIRYNWQAEFRSWHIWRHESLQQYRYMMWIDTDAFCTQVWERDPIAISMRNRLVMYFDNYPQGRAKAAQPTVKEVFGKYLCSARKSPNGQMISTLNEDCEGAQLWTIHGFHHITNLDFFRQDQVIHWAETMIGNCFLCRKFDDQLAVTVPPMMLAPERSWDMYRSGVKLQIFHNGLIDGKKNRRAGGFISYWKQNAESQFPDAWNKCEITEGD